MSEENENKTANRKGTAMMTETTKTSGNPNLAYKSEINTYRRNLREAYHLANGMIESWKRHADFPSRQNKKNLPFSAAEFEAAHDRIVELINARMMRVQEWINGTADYDLPKWDREAIGNPASVLTRIVEDESEILVATAMGRLRGIAA